MTNRHITQYKASQAAGNDYITSILAAIDSIKPNRNFAILSLIRKELVSCADKSEKEIKQAIIHILSQHLGKLSGKSHALIKYVLMQVTAIDYSIRDSNIINSNELLEDAQEWHVELQQILQRKHLDTNMFSRHDEERALLGSDVAEHAKWAFNHIYRIPYPTVSSEAAKIPRLHHGIMHVSRVASYIPVFANLYRRYGDEEALKLTAEDIKLLQIAALCHDAAREDEGVDKWDHESAVLLYFYLRRVLGADEIKAKQLAEAVANKDPSPANGYFELIEEGDDVRWRFNKNVVVDDMPKNIYQKLIHDADCLDIIRCRATFDGHHLDFYKDYASNDSKAKEEMAHVICEARSLIEIEGDSFNKTDESIKIKYEHDLAFHLVMADVHESDHPCLDVLGKRLLPVDVLREIKLINTDKFNAEGELNDCNMQAAIREGLVLARGIATPSAVSVNENETLAHFEIRKTMRHLGVATQSKKVYADQKHGNPLRSVSMIGYGSGVFTNAGFIIINPDYTAVSKIDTTNANTGRGKKTHLSHLKDKSKRMNPAIVRQKFFDLHAKLQTGGDSIVISGHHINHVEILYDITRFDAIYYSNDPNSYNISVYHQPKPFHPYTAILEAIYLRKQYERQYDLSYQHYIDNLKDGAEVFIKRHGKKRTLPIFEYSGIHNKMLQCSESKLTDEKLVKFWVEMTSDYMLKEIENDVNITNISLDDIKVLSMYGKKNIPYAKCNAPADASYSIELKKKVNEAILAEKHRLIQHYEKECILYRPALDGNLPLVKDLIAKGANVNGRSGYKKNPLYAAVENCHAVIVKYLLDNNAKTDILNDGALLYTAVQNEDIETARLLLENDPNILQMSQSKFHYENPMWKAVSSGNLEMIKLLLAHHARTDIRGNYGDTLAHCAARAGRLEILDLLLDNSPELIDAENDNGQTILSFVTSIFHLEDSKIEQVLCLFELLLKKGLRINKKVLQPLNNVLLGYLERLVCQDPLPEHTEQIATMNMFRGSNKSPIVFKSYYSPSVFELFLNSIDNINEVYLETNKSLLMWAIKMRNLDLVKLLLSKGADIEAFNVSTMRPLSYAAWKSTPAIVELLIEKGANTNAVAGDDSTSDPLLAAICNKEPAQMIECLQKSGVDINRTIDGFTALYYAAKANKTKAVKCLLSLGADANLSKEGGESPLDVAVRKGNTRIAKLLKSHLENKTSVSNRF